MPDHIRTLQFFLPAFTFRKLSLLILDPRQFGCFCHMYPMQLESPLVLLLLSVMHMMKLDRRAVVETDGLKLLLQLPMIWSLSEWVLRKGDYPAVGIFDWWISSGQTPTVTVAMRQRIYPAVATTDDLATIRARSRCLSWVNHRISRAAANNDCGSFRSGYLTVRISGWWILSGQTP